ncbi:hypothetical protein NPX13_g7491 [Xylaria arbuscula]|uniref:Uncharacterized protein n=1 Tax=Xylaria arbuscula TaxID=114810 RepID=A0A9W8NAD7_9PEZI|nr:hypothetical protein NPX13_g7491 [Xylaria arbuscula]
MSSKKPSVLITGCGEGGIGHAIAAEFLSKGTRYHDTQPLASIPLTYAILSQGYEVITTLLPHEARTHLTDAGIHVFSSDVTKDEDTMILRDHVAAITGGGLDVLVNNAGICYTMTAADSDLKEIEKMFAVNVFGPMRMVRVFHPLLVQKKGAIVNIGSVGGIVPFVYGASYNATKAALHHWGNTLRVEMKPLGVRVVNIISGEIGTNILKRDMGRQLPEGSLYRPLQANFADHCNRTPKTTPRRVYAANVVAEVVKKNPAAWFWTGETTLTVRLCDALLPRTFWDFLFTRMFSLDKLRGA